MKSPHRRPQETQEADDAVDMPSLCVGAGLGDLYHVHYYLRHLLKGKDTNEHSAAGVKCTPSEDAAMVRSSVEVNMMDNLDTEVEDPEIAASTSNISSVAGLSASKSDQTSSTADSSGCHQNNKPKLSLAQRFASSVAAHPKRHLYSTLLVCALLTIAAFVGAAVTGAKVALEGSGFTRGTLVSGRTVQLKRLIQLNQQEDNGQSDDIKDPPVSELVCSGKWYGSRHMASNEQLNLMTVWKTQDDSQNALDSDALYQMCMNEEHVLESMEENDLCYKCQERCIQPYSLVLAARLYLQAQSTRSTEVNQDIYLSPTLSCEDLRNAWTKAVQSDFTNVLLDCTNSLLAEYNLGESVSDSSKCLLPDAKMVASLVDINFPISGVVEYTSAIYASKQDSDSVDELYELDKSGAFSREGVALTGFYEVGIQPFWQTIDGGFLKRDFSSALTTDSVLALAACGMAGLFIFWHTKSLYLTLFGLLQIILALPISWLLYRFVFGLESFPASNIGGIFVVFSLGADDVFVMVDKWKNSRTIMPCASTTEVAIVSLPSAIIATLMTSITTSAAFFATNTSDIGGMRVFGNFCGLLVVVDYVLSVLLLSPVLCLYDSMMISGSPSLFVSTLVKKKESRSDAIQEAGEEATAKRHRNIRDRILGTYIDLLYSFRWPILLVSVSAITVCSVVTSAFKPPENEPLPPVLSITNPYEARSKFVENIVAFPLEKATNPSMAKQAVFGVQAIDNGDYLKRHLSDNGSIVYDDDFDAANNQIYLLEFCDKLPKPTQDYSCILQEFDSWLQLQSRSGSPDDQYLNSCNGETSVPVEADTFDLCFIAFSKLTNSTAVTYDDETNKVKAIIINSRVDSTMWSSPSEIDEDWRLTEGWSTVERSRAPEGANNFFISSYSFWYLDTLNNATASALESAFVVLGCAALVILLSCRSIELLLFSCISILYVLVAATASLAGMGWSLGIFESLLFGLLVGLGSDFILHFTHAYSMIPGKVNKQLRMKHAILHMGPSVLGSAATTMSTAIVMLFCQIATLEKFATMMIMTMVHSLIGSFVIFSVLCSCFGPAEPTKTVDFIQNKVRSQLQKLKGGVARSDSGEDVPKSIEIDSDVNNNSSSSNNRSNSNSSNNFRPKKWMIILSYLVATIIIICISFGAYSFVKSSQAQTQMMVEESTFDATADREKYDAEEAQELFIDIMVNTVDTTVQFINEWNDWVDIVAGPVD